MLIYIHTCQVYNQRWISTSVSICIHFCVLPVFLCLSLLLQHLNFLGSWQCMGVLFYTSHQHACQHIHRYDFKAMAVSPSLNWCDQTVPILLQDCLLSVLLLCCPSGKLHLHWPQQCFVNQNSTEFCVSCTISFLMDTGYSMGLSD